MTIRHRHKRELGINSSLSASLAIDIHATARGADNKRTTAIADVTPERLAMG